MEQGVSQQVSCMCEVVRSRFCPARRPQSPGAVSHERVVIEFFLSISITVFKVEGDYSGL